MVHDRCAGGEVGSRRAYGQYVSDDVVFPGLLTSCEQTTLRYNNMLQCQQRNGLRGLVKWLEETLDL